MSWELDGFFFLFLHLLHEAEADKVVVVVQRNGIHDWGNWTISNRVHREIRFSQTGNEKISFPFLQVFIHYYEHNSMATA